TETIPIIIAKVNMEAKSLALEIGFFSPDLLDQYLVKANSHAFAIAAIVAEKDPEAIPSEVLGQVKAAAAAPPAATPAEETPPTEEKPEEEDDEDEAVAGIGGLFG
ncbi:MAG: 50S ribosomal protein L10, partial [Candidatus Thorarchaeota archaeon]|nr:50S ribosomal protein L10 [Candidatus Thorarchaeota archaeon]